jgi:hypothetical protein
MYKISIYLFILYLLSAHILFYKIDDARMRNTFSACEAWLIWIKNQSSHPNHHKHRLDCSRLSVFQVRNQQPRRVCF